MKLLNITDIIKFGTKVEIIQQDAYHLANRKNDKSIYVNDDYQYGNHREIEEFANYDVRMITSKDNYLTIYVYKDGEING